MKRRLFNLAAAVSLLLFLLVLSTYFLVVSINRYAPAPGHPGNIIVPRWNLGIGDGTLSLGIWHISSANLPAPGTFSSGLSWFAIPRPIVWYAIPDALWGFNCHTQRFAQPGSPTVTWITIPAWPALLACAILPTLWHRERRNQRRSNQDTICVSCGYDLRATPDRCPECGTVPSGYESAAKSN